MSDEQTPKQDHIPLYQPYRFAAPPAHPAAAPEPGTGRVQVHPFPELQAQAFIDMAPPSGSTSDQSSAAGSSSRDAASSGSASAGASTAATSSRRNQAPKLIVGQQYSDKSCKACRDRRVRCDRLWPACERCAKRQEDCVYPKLANIERKTDTPPDPRVVELEAKLASVQQQLKATANSIHNSPLPHPPPPIPPTSNHLPPNASHFPEGAPLSFPDKIQNAVVGHNAASLEVQVLRNFLAAEHASRMDIGPSTVDWRLMQPNLAEALTINLLDASTQACCSRLPALKMLVDRAAMYKTQLHSLDPSGQLAVAVLAALGARATPHSAILGVQSHSLSDGTATPALYLTAGQRREKACRALENRAHEIAWAGKVMQEDKWDNLHSLAGLTQLLIFEEARAKQSRFFLRNTVGMYIDLVLHKGGPDDADPETRKSVGTSLFADDTTIAPRFNSPCLIATSELEDFFVPNGLRTPDFINTRLDPIIDSILPPASMVTRDQLEQALTTTAMWVCGCQRIFSRLSTAPKPGQPSMLPEIHSLYALIDEVHCSIQRLQQFLVSISHIPPGCENDIFALDHFVLLGVRADTYLVDLVNLIHTWLLKDRSNLGGLENWAEAESDERLHKLRWESTLRVRKCLKLVAFYSQLYLASSDKHVVHHLVVQLELLPNWTHIAAQRIGSPGGPMTAEFELSEEELDWLRQALELACYFTPVAGQRLQELCSERLKHTQPQSSQENPMGHHSPPDPRPSKSSENSSSSIPFGDTSAADTSPFIFDQFGVVTDNGGNGAHPLLQGLGADDSEPNNEELARRQAEAIAGFSGNSWMDVTLGNLWDDSEKDGGDLWMG